MKLTNQIAVNPIGSRLFDAVTSTAQVTTSTKISSPGMFTGVKVVFRNHIANHATMKFAIASTNTNAYTYAADNFATVRWSGQNTLTPADAVWYSPSATISDSVAAQGQLDPVVNRYHLLIRGYPVTVNGGWYSYPKPPISAARAVTAANRGEVYQIGTKAGDFVTTSSDFTDSTTAQMVGAVFNTVNPGLSVMGIGDSLLQCDGVSLSDRYSSYGLRACADASTPELPIGWWNAGGSGLTTNAYKNQGVALADTLRPNVILYHAWSPNDLWNIDASTPDTGGSGESPLWGQRTKTVSATALGGGDGSPGNPWTLAEACAQAGAAGNGEIVGLLPGLYIGTRPDTGSLDIDDQKLVYTPAFGPAHSGTKDNPIIFVAQYPAAYNSEDMAKVSEIRSGGTLVQENNGTYLRRGWPAFGAFRQDNIQWIGMYTDCREADNKQYQNSAPCCLRTGDNLVCAQARIIGERGAPYGGDNYSGIRFENTVDAIAEDNWITDFWWLSGGRDEGVITFSTNNTVIKNNRFERCAFAVYNKGCRWDGSKLWGNYGHILNNYVGDCQQGIRTGHYGYIPGWAKEPQGFMSKVQHNVFARCDAIFMTSEGGMWPYGNYTYANYLDIQYNTFYFDDATSEPGITRNTYLPFEGPHDDNIFKNNVVYTRRPYTGFSYNGAAADKVEFVKNWADYDYNVIHCTNANLFGTTTPYTAWSQQTWQSFGNDVNSVFADPQFKNLEGGDFTLSPGSPALSAGSDGGEVGAYAKGAVVGIRFLSPVDPSLNTVQSLADAMMQRTNDMAVYCQQKDIAFIACTGIPQPKAGKLDTVQRDDIRKSFNATLRSSGYTILDLAALIGDGQSPEGMIPELAEGDGTHYNEAALDVIAAELAPILQTVAASMEGSPVEPSASIYDLVPNFDETQHTDYPAGDK